MPITLPPISRRRFLAGSLAAGASFSSLANLVADEPQTDADRFALLSDTHISENRAEVFSGARMAGHFEHVAAELLALQKVPANVLINGDCAYLRGKAKDYDVLGSLLKPLRKKGMPIHLVLGNHDHRERIWKAFPAEKEQDQPVENRHISLISTPRANWFLLDSLDRTNVTPGILGKKQIAWLTKALDARSKKPAMIVVHHNPDHRAKTSGLTDTKALLAAIVPRRHVKVVFFGHTHNWHTKKHEGIHLVNLPPVAYVFAKEKPSGWVDAQLTDSAISLTLQSIDKKHRQHGERLKLNWRS